MHAQCTSCLPIGNFKAGSCLHHVMCTGFVSHIYWCDLSTAPRPATASLAEMRALELCISDEECAMIVLQ